MSVTIRSAKDEDTGEICEMLDRLADFRADRNHSVRKTIHDPLAELLVAEVNGSVVGVVHQVFFEDPLHGGQCSLITNLFVRKTARGKGVASKLVQRTLETARTRGVKEVHVTTLKSNTTAVRLYERLGFRKEGMLLETNP